MHKPLIQYYTVLVTPLGVDKSVSRSGCHLYTGFQALLPIILVTITADLSTYFGIDPYLLPSSLLVPCLALLCLFHVLSHPYCVTSAASARLEWFVWSCRNVEFVTEVPKMTIGAITCGADFLASKFANSMHANLYFLLKRDPKCPIREQSEQSHEVRTIWPPNLQIRSIQVCTFCT